MFPAASIASAATKLLAFGFQVASREPSALSRAMFERNVAASPIASKAPPITVRPEASRTIARTSPGRNTVGQPASAAPVAAEIAPNPPRDCPPIVRKCPPT